MERREVVIVGGGPGGLAAAKILAENGKDVLLLEKNREIGKKVCAGGITQKDFEFIPKKLFEREFSEVKVHTPLQSISVRMEKPFLVTLDRGELGKWMAAEAAKAGAEIRMGEEVSRVAGNEAEVGNRKIAFEYLIGADGSDSVVRKSLGIGGARIATAFHYIIPQGFEHLEIFFDVSRFGPWYAWIFPHRNYTSIGTGGDPKFLSMGKLRKNFEDWCEGKFELDGATFEAHPINCGYAGFEFGKKFLIGDAAGFTSALTGEGIYFAIVSGQEVARKIINKDYSFPKIQELLKLKRRHERLLRLIQLNEHVARLGYEGLLLALRSGWVAKRLIKLYA